MDNSEKLLINQLKPYALSDSDINTILNPDTKINLYKDIDSINHFDELLDKYERCIMLYGTEAENIGHWVSLLKKGNTVEFFDSYGNNPFDLAEGLKIPPMLDKYINKGGIVKLMKLIHKSGYDLIYNNVPYQIEASNIATCGRHSVFRVIMHKLTLEEYHKLMKDMKKEIGNVNYDQLIIGVTYPILNK